MEAAITPAVSLSDGAAASPRRWCHRTARPVAPWPLWRRSALKTHTFGENESESPPATVFFSYCVAVIDRTLNITQQPPESLSDGSASDSKGEQAVERHFIHAESIHPPGGKKATRHKRCVYERVISFTIMEYSNVTDLFVFVFLCTLPERINIHHAILRFKDSLLRNVLQTSHGHGNRRPTRGTKKTMRLKSMGPQMHYAVYGTVSGFSPSRLWSLHGRDFSLCYLHH